MSAPSRKPGRSRQRGGTGRRATGAASPERDFAHLRRRVLRAERPLPGLEGGPGPVRCVVLYPGRYEEAMASLAVHVLLDLFNREPCEAERACLFPDFTRPVRTLESGAALGDAHLILATLQFEMQYPELARMLADSGLPPLARERSAEHPVVVVGGPAASANPAPVAAIADLIYVGEVEARIVELREALTRASAGPISRAAIIAELASVPGVLSCAEWLAGTAEGPVPPQHVVDADAYVPHSVIIAEGAELSGRALVEVSRGCPHACTFCMARQLYFPHRPRSLAAVGAALDEMVEERAAAGPTEDATDGADAAGGGRVAAVGLVAPSFADHPEAEGLLRAALDRGLTASVSSLRAETLSGRAEVLRLLRQAGQQTITLAPEAGREDLRRSLAKPITDAALLDAAAAVAEAGFPRLKLYFMLGLPGETDDDAGALGDLLARMRAAAPGVEVSASVAPFVPKAHTPCEGVALAERADVERRARMATAAAAAAGVDLDVASPRLARVQAILARGGLELGELLATKRVRDRGAAALPAAMRRAGLDPEAYARDGSPDRPWKMVAAPRPATKPPGGPEGHT